MNDVDWLEDGDGDWERTVAQREQARLHDTHVNAGFREAAAAAQETVLQDSFNKGFGEGIARGRRWGELHGMASALLEVCNARGFSAAGEAATDIMCEVEETAPDSTFDDVVYAALRGKFEALLAECAAAIAAAN